MSDHADLEVDIAPGEVLEVRSGGTVIGHIELDPGGPEPGGGTKVFAVPRGPTELLRADGTLLASFPDEVIELRLRLRRRELEI